MGDAPNSTYSHDFLAGHLGHLSKQQQDSLVTFKESLSKANLYTPPSEAGKASHDEQTLLCV